MSPARITTSNSSFDGGSNGSNSRCRSDRIRSLMLEVVVEIGAFGWHRQAESRAKLFKHLGWQSQPFLDGSSPLEQRQQLRRRGVVNQRHTCKLLNMVR